VPKRHAQTVGKQKYRYCSYLNRLIDYTTAVAVMVVVTVTNARCPFVYRNIIYSVTVTWCSTV